MPLEMLRLAPSAQFLATWRRVKKLGRQLNEPLFDRWSWQNAVISVVSNRAEIQFRSVPGQDFPLLRLVV